MSSGVGWWLMGGMVSSGVGWWLMGGMGGYGWS